MENIRFKIYMKYNSEPIIFSTNKSDLNVISNENSLKLVQWLKDGYGSKGIKCENNKRFILYKENISYVELEVLKEIKE